MRRFLPLLTWLGLALLFAGCHEDPYLTVNPSNLSFPEEGGSQTIQVSANYAWTASVSGSGFKISPASGEGVGTVTVTAPAASSSDEVTGSVSFQSEGLTAGVTLKQAAKSTINVGSVSRIPVEGGTVTVDIQYNTDFTVEIESAAQSWISYAGTKSLSSGKLTFDFKANDSTDPRTGKVTVKDKSGKVSPITLTFEQDEKKVIQVGETTTIPAAGGTFTVDVQYNTDFSVEVEKSAQSWITFVQTKALTSGKLEFSFKANDQYEERSGKATIKDKSGKVSSITLTFKQEAKKWVDVTGIRLNMESAEVETGGKLTLTATVSPKDASDPAVTWSSDKTSVATVDNQGVVTGVAKGTATITAKAGKVSAKCIVTVLPSPIESERETLVSFYKATGGDKWTNNANWCSDKPVSEWYGIMTNDQGRVISVLLDVNNLTGKIPPEIFSLAKLQNLHLSYNSLTGEIPKEVANAKVLENLSIEMNQLSGPIPESLYEMKKLNRLFAWGNQLSGNLSEKFWDMPELQQLALDDNRITGTLTAAVKKAKKLIWLGLGSNYLTGTIPPEITELKDLYYFSLENHAVSNGSFSEAANTFYGPIPDNLDKLQDLNYFLVENNNLEGNLPVCVARMPKLTCLEVYGNRLSGEIPAEVVECANWDTWAPDKNIMPQQKGYVLSFSHYESTDFSQDGKVIRLQTHDKGNGISLVITGDCFTDQDIAAGEFEKIARQTMEDFFAVEPFTTFRNLFDVHAVVAVSKSRYSDYGTALGAVFGEGSYVYCDQNKVMDYSRKAVSNLDETLTIVIVNKNSNSGTAYMPPYPTIDTDYGSGFSYACFGLQYDGAGRRLLINHEANGHAFTKLQDEYYIRGGSPYPEDNKQYIKETFFSKGFYANVDFESDPKKVKWSKFLFDDRYKYDGLGVFAGGMTFEQGVFRPSENSIMAHQSETGEGSRFNAPSREAAYIRIHKLAYGSSWQYDYEEFVKYDAINRWTSVTKAPAKASTNGTAPVNHTPPKFLKPVN